MLQGSARAAGHWPISGQAPGGVSGPRVVQDDGEGAPEEAGTFEVSRWGGDLGRE